jgi:hypothetical protein
MPHARGEGDSAPIVERAENQRRVRYKKWRRRPAGSIGILATSFKLYMRSKLLHQGNRTYNA